MKISKKKKKTNLDYTNMIISAKFQVSILKTAPAMLRTHTATHKYINKHGSIATQNVPKTEESISSELPFKKVGKFPMQRKLV